MNHKVIIKEAFGLQTLGMEDILSDTPDGFDEIVEEGSKIAEAEGNILQLNEVSDALEGLLLTIESGPKGLTTREVSLLSMQVDSIAGPMASRELGIESLSETTPEEAYVVSVEKISDLIGKAFSAVVEFLRHLWDAVVSIWDKFFGTAGKVKKRAEALRSEIAKSKDKSKSAERVKFAGLRHLTRNNRSNAADHRSAVEVLKAHRIMGTYYTHTWPEKVVEYYNNLSKLIINLDDINKKNASSEWDGQDEEMKAKAQSGFSWFNDRLKKDVIHGEIGGGYEVTDADIMPIYSKIMDKEQAPAFAFTPPMLKKTYDKVSVEDAPALNKEECIDVLNLTIDVVDDVIASKDIITKARKDTGKFIDDFSRRIKGGNFVVRGIMKAYINVAFKLIRYAWLNISVDMAKLNLFAAKAGYNYAAASWGLLTDSAAHVHEGEIYDGDLDPNAEFRDITDYTDPNDFKPAPKNAKKLKHF